MSNKHHDLLGVPKHANQHRLSRLTMEVHTDELRIVASAVESYTDELIAALEAAEKRNTELNEALKQTVSGYKSCLRTGHERILELGGDCDAPEVMIAGNTDIQQAEKLLAAAAGKGEA